MIIFLSDLVVDCSSDIPASTSPRWGPKAAKCKEKRRFHEVTSLSAKSSSIIEAIFWPH